MGISIDKVLQRMQAEMNRAQAAGNFQKKREHLAAIRSLCELALETDGEQDAAPGAQTQTIAYPANALRSPAQASPHAANFPVKPMKEDDANGDSIFDF